MRVLIVLTSHDKLGNTGRKTASLKNWPRPYHVWLTGAEITLASLRAVSPRSIRKATNQFPDGPNTALRGRSSCQ
jgi:hypothetical protein